VSEREHLLGLFPFLNIIVSKQGVEMTFGTNHLGHFYLTKLLLLMLKSTPGSRIVNVASKAQADIKEEEIRNLAYIPDMKLGDSFSFSRQIDIYSKSKVYSITSDFFVTADSRLLDCQCIVY